MLDANLINIIIHWNSSAGLVKIFATICSISSFTFINIVATIPEQPFLLEINIWGMNYYFCTNNVSKYCPNGPYLPTSLHKTYHH
jgi:hypothetical protein